jgi:hypothetical protein
MPAVQRCRRGCRRAGHDDRRNGIRLDASRGAPENAPPTGLQALTAFMKRSRMTTGSIVITGIFALPLSHLQTMIVISPESSAS